MNAKKDRFRYNFDLFLHVLKQIEGLEDIFWNMSLVNPIMRWRGLK